MIITRQNEPTHGAYYTTVEGAVRNAELTWRAHGKVRIAEHTFTPPEARGKGTGLALVEALIEDARAEGFRIVPACSYVEAQFRKHPDWCDVLAQGAY